MYTRLINRRWLLLHTPIGHIKIISACKMVCTFQSVTKNRIIFNWKNVANSYFKWAHNVCIVLKKIHFEFIVSVLIKIIQSIVLKRNERCEAENRTKQSSPGLKIDELVHINVWRKHSMCVTPPQNWRGVELRNAKRLRKLSQKSQSFAHRPYNLKEDY